MTLVRGLWIDALLILIVVLVGAWLFGNAAVQPGSYAVPPARAPARDLQLTSPDGLLIAATYWPGRTPNAPGVLMLHGNGGSRQTMAGNAAWLAREGYAVLALDFRGHGQSDPRPRSFGLFESRDAAAGFAWLKRQQQGARIGVIGVSLGGAASLLGDAGPLAADAMVLQAVYPDIHRAIRNRIASMAGNAAGWAFEPLLSLQAPIRYGVWPGRISPVAALARYPGPVLVIGGGEDRYTPPAETREMFAAAHGPKSLWIVPGHDHGGVSGMESPEYRARVGGFLARTLGRP